MKEDGESNLPNYVNTYGHGEQAYPGPLAINDVVGYAFPIMVNKKKLQAFVDDQLNGLQKNGSPVRYEALDLVLLSWTNCGKAYSLSVEVGCMGDQECQFFVPLLQYKGDDPIPRLMFWIPYLFINLTGGLIMAREVWGFRKMPATIHIPRQVPFAARFTAETLVFKTFDNAVPGVNERIVETVGPSVIEKLEKAWEEPELALLELLKLLEGHLAVEALRLLNKVLTPMFGDFIFHMLNLKQFRDGVNNEKACYQALLSCPGVLNDWTGGGVLAGQFKTTIATCANYSIVDDLGLADAVGAESTTIEHPFGFWITMNFTLDNASLIWRAPGT